MGGGAMRRVAAQSVRAIAILTSFVNTACAAPLLLGEPEVVGEIRDPRLNELSGLVESRRSPNHFYTHNDSGGAPSVYLLTRGGILRAEIRLRDAKNVDWEDISLAPGEKGGFDVCAADIGDNKRKRKEIVIYRFAEPELPSASGAVVDVTPHVYRLQYPDGMHNAEAFMVHPATGEGFLLTKNEDVGGGSELYTLAPPWNENDVNTLKRVAVVAFPQTLPLNTVITAGDISPDGRRLLARGYPVAWEWRLPDGVAVSEFAQIVTKPATEITIAAESQGEAICYSIDGKTAYTTSEGSPTKIYAIPLGDDPSATTQATPAKEKKTP